MTDTFDQYGDEDDEQQQERFVQLSRKDVRRLEERAKKADEAEARAAEMEREVAFSRAGVDPQHPAARYFTAPSGYSGDMTPEAIKEEWAKIAGVGTGQQQQTQQAADEELAQIRAASQLVTGGLADIPTNRLAERDAKLKELLQGPPSLAKERQFQEILEEYGTTMAQ